MLPLGSRDALITHWVELFERHDIKAENDIYIVTNGQCFDSFKAWASQHHIPEDHVVSDGTETNETRLGAVPDILFGIKQFGFEFIRCIGCWRRYSIFERFQTGCIFKQISSIELQRKELFGDNLCSLG